MKQPWQAHTTTPMFEPLLRPLPAERDQTPRETPKTPTKKFRCTPKQSQAQASTFIGAKRKNGRFTACPAADWLHLLPKIWTPHQVCVILLAVGKFFVGSASAGSRWGYLGLCPT